ncbi:LST1 isoform 5 [Pan troglodytes]|uniref:LST1 isoform 5 n=2 Tax=Homininae TaxID=207598 RepID=A0A2J8NXR7_PANTR|nr:leukocyte specific transcript 1, isoform CRA_d [Homo sapiens]KAI2541585.1 leukocyte specific transcript 1 [Homo sapiens]KAI4017550.1 leukocyte specific transcript 1 [Homo sapiens]PNI76550.1 LST1 isoform 5 [Pan troglodytes]
MLSRNDVKRLERSWRLPVPSSEGPDLRGRDKRGTKEDPRADYACIAENKPT